MSKFLIMLTVTTLVIIAQPLVSAQNYEIYHTTLILNAIPRIVEEGDHVIFSGSLFTVDGKTPLTDRLVFIEYDNPYDCTRILATTTTDSNGNFSVVWKALPKGYSGGTYNLFAKFNGDDNDFYSISKQFRLEVIPHSLPASALIVQQDDMILPGPC